MVGVYAEKVRTAQIYDSVNQFLLDIKTFMVIFREYDLPPRHIADRLLRHERGTILLKKLCDG